MAEKNLILKLKLETDTSSGDKLVKLIKDQVTNTTAIITETEKLKKAEQDRVNQATANEKRLSEITKEVFKVKKDAEKASNDFIKSYKDKLAESNTLIEEQGKGWGLVASRVQATITKFNLAQASQTNSKLQQLALEKLSIDRDNLKISLANSLASAQQRVTAAYAKQVELLQLQAALSSKGYSFVSGAKGETPTTEAAAGTGVSAARWQPQGGYGFGTSQTVKANAEKAAKELADRNRKTFQDELALGTAAARQLYNIRIASFNAAMTQQENAMRHSVAIEIAVQTNGINSIQATRARVAQQEFQLEERYQAQLASIRRSVASGATPISAGNAAMTAATTAHTQALATNRIQLNQQEAALNAAANAHQNLFIRVGEAIGAYRIWNTAINAVTTSMRAIPKIGIEMESTIASLTATTGSAAGMGSVMVALEKEAERTGITIGTLRETFRGFQASTSLAGESVQSTWKMFTNLNTVITGLHLPAEKASGIFLAMAQIFNKGKVQSEELVKQLGNLLPGAFASFAAANMGAGKQFVSTIDLINQMKKGMVFAHITVENFTNYMVDRFAPAFALASQGLNSNIGRMQTSFTLLGEAIYNSTSGPLVAATKAITSFTNYLTAAVQGTNNFSQVLSGVWALAIGTVTALLIKGASTLLTYTTAMQTLTGVAALSARGMGILNTSMAFLSSPTAIIAGLTGIAFYLHSINQETTDLMAKAEAIRKSRGEQATASTTEAGKLEYDAKQDPQVKEAQKLLKDVDDKIARQKTVIAATPMFSFNSKQEVATLKQLLEDKKTFQESYDSAYFKSKSALEAESNKTSATLLEASEKNKYDVHQAWLDKRKDLNSQIEKVSLAFEEKYAGQRKALLLSKEAGESPKATEEQIQASLESKRYLVELEEAKSREILAVKETFAKAQEALDKKSGAAANKELRLAYKDSERDIKFSIEVTKLALDDLSVAYADNSISIAEYYKKKEELQLKNIANEKAIKEGELATATKGGDKAAMAKLQDEIKLLDITAQRIHPAITKDQSKDVLAFNNAVAQTNIEYLQLTGSTVAAAKAQEELNTAQQRKQLGAEIKAGGTTAPMAQKALDQLNANKENELLQANFDQAKKYRDALNSIQQAYVQMGATSSDVLTASLGGFSPLFNLFDNFQAKQAEQLISMRELQAEAELIANRKITEGDTEGAAKKAKDAEINAKQVQLLDKQTAQNKIKTTREAFAIGESLLKEGSKAQKIAHVASMAYNVAEKFGLLGTLAVKGASAVLEQGKGDPYTAFARMAAMAALVASVISAVGGGSTSVSSSAAPVSTGTGTVLGDPTAESASLDNSLQLLQDINYKSYRELVKVNSNLTASSNFINQIATINAKGNLLKPPTTGGVELGTFDSKMGTAISEAIRNYMSLGLTNLLRKIPVIGQIGDAITKFLVKGLFGSVTRKITDSGIQTNQQQAYTLIAGMNLSISQYTTVEETFKSWFKKSTKTFDVLDTASKQAVSSFTSLYKSIGTAVLTLAEGLSKAAVDATYLYKFPAIKVSFQGKSSEKIVSTMKAVISKQLDLMATKVFGDVFGGLQQLGEGMFQTVNRIYAERVVAKKSFEDIGATFPKGIEEGVKLADALVQVSSNADTAAGKLKEFAQQQADFFKNFASTVTQNNTVVSDFIGSLKDIFTIGLSIDQVNSTKAYVNSISSSVVALNLAQRNYDTSLVKSKELVKAETAYNKKPTVANKAKLDKLEIPYQTKISETTAALAIATAQHNTAQQVSIGNFETLQQVFIRTVKTTGSFSQAIIEMRKNLDVTTESGQKTYSMITQLDSAFTKLVDDVIKPVTDQITTIADSIDTRTKETLLSQLAASRDYTTQKTLTTKIQKLITDKYNTEKTSINTIKNAFITLAQTVKDLLLGDLSTFNPFEKFQEAQKQYTDLLTLSQSNDVTIAADAASKLGSAAQKYLGEAKSYYGSTAVYADIFSQVVGTLTDMSTSNITQGTNATDMINALGAAAIVELQGLADTTTAAILATLEQGILALDITETTRNASDELATLASSAVNLGLTFEAMIVKFNTVMGTVPQGQTSNMQTLTANLAAAIANKDKKGATAIQAQITSYSKGFKKGGIPLGELYATNRTTLQTNAATIAADQLKLKDKNLLPAAKKVIQDEILALKASTATITKIGAFADGGMASGLSLVGERGPELIQLPNSTRVTSNTNTNRILADSNKETLNVLTDMKKELIILNNRMEVIERKTRLSKSTMSMA